MEEIQKLNKQREKQQARLDSPFFTILLALILFFGCQIISAFFIQPFLPQIESKNLQIFLYTTINVLALFVLLRVNLRKQFRRSIGLVGTKAKNFALVFPVFLGYLIFSVGLSAIIALVFSNFNPQQAQEIGFSKDLQSWELLAAFVSLVILTPLFEEIIFRGVLFRGLRKRLSFWLSTILVSIIFAVAHGQWNVALDTFALSVAICYITEKSDSILPAILMHALKNSIAFTLLFII